MPTQQAAFRQLYLNEWREGHAEPWLATSIWDEGATDASEMPPPGTRVWLGVDLSATTDLTAIVALFEHGDGYLAVPKFFVPLEGASRTLKNARVCAPDVIRCAGGER